MDYRSIARFLAFIMLFIAFVMAIPLAMAFMHGESSSFNGFLKTIAMMVIISIVALAMTSGHAMNIGMKEAVLTVSMTWAVMAAFGALPMYFSGAADSYAKCFFEIVSGFTTAGASVFPDVESLDKSILFWRSLTNWLGGMGVVVLFVAVLPIFGVKGNALVGAEAVGPSKSKLTPTIRGTAMVLWLIYIGLSALEVVLLYFGGMDWFNAFTVMFGTIGAAGFVPVNESIASYHSAYAEWVCTVFMLLAGINFSIFFYVIRGNFRKAAANSELRLYLALIAIAAVLVSIQLISRKVYPMHDAIRQSLFHVVSMITTTGFVADEFNSWPMFSQMLLVMFCFIGACSGSAGGGMKVIRIGVMMRLGYNSMMKRIHPNAVSPLSFGTDHLDSGTAFSIAGYAGCYFATLFLGAAIIGLTDMDFTTCFASVFLCLSNLGTGIGGLGADFSFCIFPDWSLWVFSFLMIAGRLEFYTVYTLFTRSFWRR